MDSDKNLLNKIVSALTGGTDTDVEGNSSKDNLNKNFCVEETLSPTDIEVTVKEVGKLSFPLSKAYIQKLIDVSTTAKFGMGEKTVLDRNVRDTQMIELKSLNVTINQESLSRITNNMQKALDLPADSALTPHLYNMLIYGPGQFFNKHRDSEKLPNMVATLVIILPSPHIGGELIIEHGKKKHIFSSENIDEENVKCICFYSDCLHNVNKVKSGYRVALTFNVVLETSKLPDPIPCTNEELKAAVQEYFKAAVNVRPKKLVFFLDHAYSEHSLFWNLLKGKDCEYASNMRSVARELDLDVHLVLAKIRQSWSSACDYKADPDWLIDTNSTLNSWVDANNVKLPCGEYSTTRSEICFARDTHYANFDPTEEEFSGPTGNAGATVDYWYKRGAIVLWQKSDSLMIKFELNYDGAMAELRSLISVPGNDKKVVEILEKAAELSQKDRPTTNDFETFVNVALYVNAKKEAQVILSPFRPNILIPENVQMLIQLQQRYGIDWLIEFFESLRGGKSYGYYSSSMASEAVNPFVHEFLNSGGDQSAVEFLLNAEVTIFISQQPGRWNFHFGKADSLERPRELFKACEAVGNAVLQEKLSQCLISQPKLFPKNELVELYHHLQKNLLPENSELFRARLEEGVKQELSSQTRDGNDWSLSEVLSCSCEHCRVVMDFLRSKTETSKSYPANEKIRKHVMYKLKSSEAPVEVTIDRNGRPFSLVLVKSATLHADAARRCTALKAILQTLEPKNATKKRQSLMENDDEKRQKV